MLQTEQAYYQPTPQPPTPFENDLGVFKGDPIFPCTDKEPCDAGWALRVLKSKDISILGAGFYSWFQTYDETCVDSLNCQKVMTQLASNRGGISIRNVVTIGSTYMVESDGSLVKASDNLAVSEHPFWSYITTFDAGNTTDVYLPQI